MTHLHGDSLYLVAVDHYLQLTGFRKTEAGWLALKNHYDAPVQVDMIEDRLPSRYEIVGRVVHIFKGPDLEAMPPKPPKPKKVHKAVPNGDVAPSRY